MQFKTSAGHIESLLHHILQMQGSADVAVQHIGLDLTADELKARAETMREPVKSIVLAEVERRRS